MSWKEIDKRIKDYEQTKKSKKQRPAFSTLERVKNEMLTPEEGLKLLQEGNEPFCDFQITVIESALKYGKLPRKRKSLRYDLWDVEV